MLNESYSGNETIEDSLATFTCIADGFPLPRIVWLHNDSLVLPSSRHIVSTTVIDSTHRSYVTEAQNSTLIVAGVRPRDAGNYLCRVDPINIDRGTSVSSSVYELNVVPGGSVTCVM